MNPGLYGTSLSYMIFRKGNARRKLPQYTKNSKAQHGQSPGSAFADPLLEHVLKPEAWLAAAYLGALANLLHSIAMVPLLQEDQEGLEEGQEGEEEHRGEELLLSASKAATQVNKCLLRSDARMRSHSVMQACTACAQTHMQSIILPEFATHRSSTCSTSRAVKK